jgi:hypothetical protein
VEQSFRLVETSPDSYFAFYANQNISIRMSEVLWWREETWWERKSLPIFGFNLAPRQLLALGSTGLLGFVFSSTLLRDSLFGRVGVLLFLLSIGFVFATKRVKMAPVELQLYYKFIRKQGVLRSPAKAQRVTAPKTMLPAKAGISHRPLLFGTVAGCLLATSFLSTLADNLALKVTGEGLVVFVVIAGVFSFEIDRRLRRVGAEFPANSADKILSGVILSVVLYIISLHSSPMILIPEIACGFLIIQGALGVRRSPIRRNEAAESKS